MYRIYKYIHIYPYTQYADTLFEIPSTWHLKLSLLASFYTYNCSHSFLRYYAEIFASVKPLTLLNSEIRAWCYLLFKGENTEAKRALLTCWQSHNGKGAKIVSSALLTTVLFARTLYSQHSSHFLPLVLVQSVLFCTWHSWISLCFNSPK